MCKQREAERHDDGEVARVADKVVVGSVGEWRGVVAVAEVFALAREAGEGSGSGLGLGMCCGGGSGREVRERWAPVAPPEARRVGAWVRAPVAPPEAREVRAPVAPPEARQGGPAGGTCGCAGGRLWLSKYKRNGNNQVQLGVHKKKMSYLYSLSPTPAMDALTVGFFVLYISLAATVSSLSANNSDGVIKAHRAFARLSAFAFSILLGIWGSLRWTNANSSTAIGAIVIGSSFLIAGTFADTYKDPTKDGTTERFAATTSALFPAMVGLTGAGIVKYINFTKK